jgi:hypothetical protein
VGTGVAGVVTVAVVVVVAGVTVGGAGGGGGRCRSLGACRRRGFLCLQRTRLRREPGLRLGSELRLPRRLGRRLFGLELRDLGLHAGEEPFPLVEQGSDALTLTVTLLERDRSPSNRLRRCPCGGCVAVARCGRLLRQLLVRGRDGTRSVEAVEHVRNTGAAEHDAERRVLVVVALVQGAQARRDVRHRHASLLHGCTKAAAIDEQLSLRHRELVARAVPRLDARLEALVELVHLREHCLGLSLLRLQPVLRRRRREVAGKQRGYQHHTRRGKCRPRDHHSVLPPWLCETLVLLRELPSSDGTNCARQRAFRRRRAT